MADNITHGLAAALLAQAGLRQRYGALATAALLVGSELPDLDALFELGGPSSALCTIVASRIRCWAVPGSRCLAPRCCGACGAHTPIGA